MGLVGLQSKPASNPLRVGLSASDSDERMKGQWGKSFLQSWVADPACQDLWNRTWLQEASSLFSETQKSNGLPHNCGILRKWTQKCIWAISGNAVTLDCSRPIQEELPVSFAPSNRSKKGEAPSDLDPPGRVKGVAAVVAAAGVSSRMGRFKPLLPWRYGTVIEAVAASLAEGGASPIIVVTGHRGAEIAEQLMGGPAKAVFNPDYRLNEMLRSYQVGVEVLCRKGECVQGALLALGDQPHIPAGVIRQIIGRALVEPEAVVVPSFMQRRGHPVYLPKRVFSKLLGLSRGQSLRTLLHALSDRIVYETVDSDCVRRDMDVPAEYDSLRAEFEWVD